MWLEERRLIARFFVQDLLAMRPTHAAEKKSLKHWNSLTKENKTKRLLEYVVKFRRSGDGPPDAFSLRERETAAVALAAVLKTVVVQEDNQLPDMTSPADVPAPTALLTVIALVAQVTVSFSKEEMAAYRHARKSPWQLQQEEMDTQAARQLQEELNSFAEAEANAAVKHYKDMLFQAQEEERKEHPDQELVADLLAQAELARTHFNTSTHTAQKEERRQQIEDKTAQQEDEDEDEDEESSSSSEGDQEHEDEGADEKEEEDIGFPETDGEENSGGDAGDDDNAAARTILNAELDDDDDDDDDDYMEQNDVAPVAEEPKRRKERKANITHPFPGGKARWSAPFVKVTLAGMRDLLNDALDQWSKVSPQSKST